MNHIIISAVIFAVSIGAHYLRHIFTKKWQAANQTEINNFKREFGEKMTLYPKNHSAIFRSIAFGIVGSFVYLVIAVLLFFFA